MAELRPGFHVPNTWITSKPFLLTGTFCLKNEVSVEQDSKAMDPLDGLVLGRYHICSCLHCAGKLAN
jgi:hypothetical protein